MYTPRFLDHNRDLKERLTHYLKTVLGMPLSLTKTESSLSKQPDTPIIISDQNSAN